MVMTAGLISEYTNTPAREELEGLLLRVGQGDRHAFERLYRGAVGAVYALSLSYLHSGDQAQDVTQDAFVRIWENAPGYRPQGKPMAWMLTVAKNLCLMRLRERGREQSLEDEEWAAIPASGSGRVSLEERVLLQQALAQLSDRERRVVLLHAAAGLRHREIAALLEQPLPTVLSQYRRALKKMNLWLKGEEKA